MKTIKFFASIGVHPGYFHANDGNLALDAPLVWQQKATEVFEETQVFVGAVFSKSKTVYHREWGCPEGGEETYCITGECNPNYTDIEKYKTQVVEVLKRTAQALEQSTTQLTFIEADFVYLDFRERK